MKICINCVMPSTKHELLYDEDWVCDTCQLHPEKNQTVNFKMIDSFINLENNA